jgi:hypothetical protein
MSDHQPVLPLFIGDVVRLRRKHACGGRAWLVDRLGADIGLACQTCGRHVMLDRRTLESRLVDFLVRGEPPMSAAIPNAADGPDA